MKRKFTKLLMLIAFSFITPGVIAQTIYVNAANTNPTKDGTTWNTAYDNLQTAIDAASSGNEIWVAKGIYYPNTQLDPTGTDRDKTFILKEGVKVYGGFAGNELPSFDLATRNFVANETILSGDFNNDDGQTIDADGVISSLTNISENAHHVVVSYNNTAATVLDGFTIKGGNADGTGTVTVDTDYDFARTSGGGVYTRKSSPTLTNLLVKNNQANLNGAGIYVSTGRMIESPKSAEDITISNCSFEYNWGSDVGTSFSGSVGAGMYVTGTANYLYQANLTNLNFKGNWGGGIAGALRVGTNVNAEVISSSFINNRSRHGGAVYIQSNTTTPLKIIGCTFTKNFEANGGAIEGNNATNLILENTIFNKNNATNGGAIYIVGSANTRSTLNITGGEFNENTATTAGGIRVSQSVALNIDGTDFSKNSGGAINILGATDLSSNVTISNSNFIENDYTEGGAIRASTNSTLDLINSNFKKNTSTTNGGAIFMTGLAAPNMSVVTIKGGVFEENYTDGMGGALYRLTNSKLNIDNVKFIGHEPKGSGGAIYVSGNNGVEDAYNNILFYKNKSITSSGGGITIAGAAKAKLVGATFYGNEGTVGGAIRLTSTSGGLKLYNSVIYSNTAGTDNTHDISDPGATVEVKNTLTQIYGTDGVDGDKVGQIPLFMSLDDTDPLFLVPAPGVNPILDAGDNNLIPVGITTDLAGRNRLGGNGTVDMGAYEYHAVLPVSLSQFVAKVQTNGVQLSWTTQREQGANHYVVERSTDGMNYTALSSIQARGTAASYNYTDKNPASGVNYYRLQQVDADGVNKVYGPLVVNYTLQEKVSVYPNPVRGNTIKISGLAQGNYSYKLISSSGTVVQQGTMNGTELNISGLKAGVYVLQLGNGVQLKVIKK